MAVLSDNSYAQFYGKFRSSAPKVKVKDDNITCLANSPHDIAAGTNEGD